MKVSNEALQQITKQLERINAKLECLNENLESWISTYADVHTQ